MHAAFCRCQPAGRSVIRLPGNVLKLTLAVILLASFAGPIVAETSRSRSHELSSDWRFSRGEAGGEKDPDFDDSSWQTVRVPHDWAIEGPFDPQQDGSSAKLPWRGVGWYRTSFVLDQQPGDRVYIDFDGVMAFAKVFVNGKPAGEWDYGYTSFRVDATPYVRLRGENTLAVRVDTTGHGTRWYPGAGIYRKAMLQIRKPVHLAHWGTFVTTPTVSDEAATVHIRTTIENHTEEVASVAIEFSLQPSNGGGTDVAAGRQQLQVPPGPTVVEQTMHVDKPLIWDILSPNLYRLRTTLRNAGEVVDVEDAPVGLRTFQFTADDGFHLNGRRVQLHGVNLHHDHGPLGAAFYPRAMERQLEIMQEMGVNAVRTSHNPPAPELLDICDRMGILVMEECFDKWDETAGRVNGRPSLRDHAERHLRSMVLRDRNHPCLVAWSIGNEILADEEGVTPERVAMMRDVVRKYDSSRPVGMGCHIPHYTDMGIFDALDYTGWNYGRRYERYRERYADRPVIYTESASALSTRGFYELPLPKTKSDYSDRRQVASYDLNAAPWADIAEIEFQLMQRDRFVAGEFVWTGFDYLGEPTPFARHARSSYFGIVDLCGIPKDRYYIYRSHWRPETPTIHIVPHWNWPDRRGRKVPVFVYTNGDAAELFLNGKSLGVEKKNAKPKRPMNLASGRPVTASSNLHGHRAEVATDGNGVTRWCAENDDVASWWQVDLGEPQPLKCLILSFDQEAKYYGYVIEASEDSVHWEPVVLQQPSEEPRWGGARTAVHDVDARAQFVRITFADVPRHTGVACMTEFEAYAEPAESGYYLPTYSFRLRWNDVLYEPGELQAVAYRNGKRIGSAVVSTAGEPAAIRLTPDRTRLTASGDDLCYVLVEAIDEDGTVCPLAENLVHFQVRGPGEIAAVGNGNPLSLEPFQADQRELFHGKAMLIVRTLREQAGDIQILAQSAGLESAQATCRAVPPSSTARPSN